MQQLALLPHSFRVSLGRENVVSQKSPSSLLPPLATWLSSTALVLPAAS